MKIKFRFHHLLGPNGIYYPIYIKCTRKLGECSTPNLIIHNIIEGCDEDIQRS